MIRANDIVYNVSNRSVFDIAETKYVEFENDPQIPNGIVPPIEPFGSGPASINNMNGVLLAGTPRCYTSASLGLSKIIPGEPLPSLYGTKPISAMRGVPQARAMKPEFIA